MHFGSKNDLCGAGGQEGSLVGTLRFAHPTFLIQSNCGMLHIKLKNYVFYIM